MSVRCWVRSLTACSLRPIATPIAPRLNLRRGVAARRRLAHRVCPPNTTWASRAGTRQEPVHVRPAGTDNLRQTVAYRVGVARSGARRHAETMTRRTSSADDAQRGSAAPSLGNGGNRWGGRASGRALERRFESRTGLPRYSKRQRAPVRAPSGRLVGRENPDDLHTARRTPKGAPPSAHGVSAVARTG